MGRWYVTKPFKRDYPGKKAMFDAMREKLGIGGSFTCQGSGGRQSPPERTYTITEYGFDWAEPTTPAPSGRSRGKR
jgi:hypothetical protein